MTAIDSWSGPADRLAIHLADRLESGRGCTVTWLNHYSAVIAMRAGVPVGEFDYLGIDGIFLRRLLGVPVPRTSADLTLPVLLRSAKPLRIGLVGSTAEVLDVVARKLQEDFGHSVVWRS